MKSFVYLSLILMLLAVIGVSSSEKSSEDLFASIFAPSSCARACWYGIEPGVTTEEELQRKLAELNLTYTTKDIFQGKSYFLISGIYELPFIEDGYDTPRIDVANGIAAYIVLPVHIPLDVIQATWGLPSKIERSWGISILYRNKGLYFYAEKDTDYADHVTMAASDVLAQTYVIPVEDGGPPPMSSCEGVSEAICGFVSPTFPQVLKDTFTPASCEHACWLGIEPDVTTEQEALDILVANGLIPDEIQELRAASFKVEPNFPFIGELFNSGMVRFAYGRVDQIELPVNITLNQIKSAYGIPDRIIDCVDDVFQIVYASEGLVFETSDPNPDQIFRMYITNDHWLSLEYVPQPPFTSLLKDCSQALFLCDLLPSSDAQALRDMLLPADCIQACFYGLQPGITTREELEAFLAEYQLVPHVLFPQSPDDTQYQWDLPAQTPFQELGRGETFFVEGKLVYIVLTIDIPLSVIYEVFGYADEVKTYDDWVILRYKTRGIDIVLTQGSNFTRTLFVSLVVPYSKHQSYIGYLPSEPVDQPCSSYGVFPCIAPTATPMSR